MERKNNEKDRVVMSEINVTPLVDVMLVLLIIFMVTAPILKQGLDIDLPKTKGSELPKQDRITVIIKKDGTIYLNDHKVTIKQMKKKLEVISKRNPTLFLKADRKISYGEVVKVMAEIREAGIEKIGLVTEPLLIKE